MYMDDATLAYLTNPVYFSEITKHVGSPVSTDEDVKFYRRRLISLHKDLLNGQKINDTIDKAHAEFIHIAIAHFKRVDTEEILQKEYTKEEDIDIFCDHCSANHSVDSYDFDSHIVANNQELLKKEVTLSTLDDFILSTKPDVPETPPPHKRVINLRDEQFRHKGVTKKQVSIQ